MTGAQIFRIGLWAVVALVCGATLAVYLSQSTTAPTSPEAAYGSPFRLVDQNGAVITEAALRGRPSAVFFGFTHCPDVCPTTLSELAAKKAALKAEKKDLNVVFVTVDPERDTPAVMKDYVGAISPDIVGITGEPAAITDMLKGWGVHAAKVGEGADYTMDHTASTFLLDSAGRFAGTIAWGENPKTADEKLERLASL
ncbi:cytochrome oxidase assembly protein [Aureimonas sp. Leaf454]|uniref:SCO family protein n=1 Tax=Aureimonas sp. Leaf454 TaxID=1736381 RepID=UPI0006F1CC65|nr:SCO family protein [Aureimonas sp. Leaf454]KQT51046.1 cytochrome oxidase assembly protein [Aureimonas sp. Leaf454]